MNYSICRYVCVNVYIYIYIYITCVYIYIYILPLSSSLLLALLLSLSLSSSLSLCLSSCVYIYIYICWEERFYIPPPPGSDFGDCDCTRIDTKASIYHPLWVVVVVYRIGLPNINNPGLGGSVGTQHGRFFQLIVLTIIH